MRRQKRKYSTPGHPWEKERINAERRILRNYGLKRKREIWRAQTILRKYRSQARSLLTKSGGQAELETRQLFERLRKFGLVGEDPSLDDVLGLTVDRILERFLLNVVCARGLAQNPKHARQLIVHGHVWLAGRRVRSPTYMVPVGEEPTISLSPEAGQAPRTERAEVAEGE